MEADTRTTTDTADTTATTDPVRTTVPYPGTTEIARLTGADAAHISRIFHRQSRPSLSLAVRIAAVLGITVDDLCRQLGITDAI
jgi:transcriptional regulator with XRE-family HTH domain